MQSRSVVSVPILLVCFAALCFCNTAAASAPQLPLQLPKRPEGLSIGAFASSDSVLGDALRSISAFASGARTLFFGRAPRAPLPTVVRARRPAPSPRAENAAVVTGCEPGVLQWAPLLRNTCSQGPVCTVFEAFCAGAPASLTDTTAAELRANASCVVTKLRCDGIVVDLLAQFGASDCHATATHCKATTPIGECSVQVVCDPDFVTFGVDAFGFVCTRDELVCGGAVVEDVYEYDNETLPADCFIRAKRCTTEEASETCYSLACTNETDPCTFHVLGEDRCDANCTRFINTTFCICPADFAGTTCDEKANVTCSYVLVDPQPACVESSDPNDAKLMYDKPCFVYGASTASTDLVANISCSFRDPSLVNQVPLYNFSYWVSTPSLKLSSDPGWRLHAKIFNFDILSDDSHLTELELTRENLEGTSSLRITVPLSALNASFRPGNRVYLEIGFGSEDAPTSMESAVIRRMTLDLDVGNVTRSNKLSPGAIAGISVASVVAALAIVATTIALVFVSKKKSTTKKSSASKKNR